MKQKRKQNWIREKNQTEAKAKERDWKAYTLMMWNHHCPFTWAHWEDT